MESRSYSVGDGHFGHLGQIVHRYGDVVDIVAEVKYPRSDQHDVLACLEPMQGFDLIAGLLPYRSVNS